VEKEEYRYAAASIDGLLSQLVRYITHGGHYFYLRTLVPEKKDPKAVAEKLLDRYDIRRKRWQRKRRNLKDAASIHLLQHNRVLVFMLSKGRHEAFYADHGGNVLDIRRQALKVFGYSIRFAMSAEEKRWKVSVRLDKETYRKVQSHMLTLAVRDSYRSKERLEREFRRLPYQAYKPVYAQLCSIAQQVNRERRRRGFEAISLECIRKERRLRTVFIDEIKEENQTRIVNSSDA